MSKIKNEQNFVWYPAAQNKFFMGDLEELDNFILQSDHVFGLYTEPGQYSYNAVFQYIFKYEYGYNKRYYVSGYVYKDDRWQSYFWDCDDVPKSLLRRIALSRHIYKPRKFKRIK